VSMLREDPVRVALLFVAFVLGSSASGFVASAESFDKPVRKTVVNLERSRSLMPNSRSRIQLSCFYYPAFMIKQLDDPGEKGTQSVTIDSDLNGEFPACRQSHSPTEQFLAKDGWFFIGAKGSLLFFEAPDGTSGGMPFRILEMKTRKKIFEDSVWWKGHLEFASTPDGKMTLRYPRLVEGDCSIPKDGISCWSKFRRDWGLALATAPKCTGYRHEGEREWVVGDEGVPPEPITTASAIAYPVVVKLFQQPSISAVPGEVKCSPVE
jgi:hypothetical protein